MRIWIQGFEGAVPEADTVLQQVLTDLDGFKALIAPDDSPVFVTEDAKSIKTAGTLWGLIVAPTTSIRWRVEGPRALVAAVSTAPVDSATEIKATARQDADVLLMWGGYVKETSFGKGVGRVFYVGDDGEEFVRYTLGVAK